MTPGKQPKTGKSDVLINTVLPFVFWAGLCFAFTTACQMSQKPDKAQAGFHEMPELLQRAEQRVTAIFNSDWPEAYHYHNLRHTQEVVLAAKEISAACRLDSTATTLVLLAAWFHDAGYKNKPDDHETASQQLAVAFLEEVGLDAQKCAAVSAIIGATRMPQNPVDLPGQVLADADLSHLASPNSWQVSARLRQEWETLSGKTYTDREWLLNTLAFMKSHTYFTVYGRETLEKGKQENIARFEKALADGTVPE